MRPFSMLLVILLASWVSARPIGQRTLSAHLEDFDNYLKDTLDGEPGEEFDELEDELQNHWELSGKFEGDIILSDRQQKALLNVAAQEGLERNGLRDSSRRWPGKTVVYKIMNRHFNDDQIQTIKDGLADIERVSCIKFKEKGPRDRDYVRIQGLRRGCYSKVGYQGNGAQVLNLTPHPPGLGCMRPGTVVHEMLHSLGFFHQQSATDRDKYVKINWQNIRPGTEHNFKKYNSLVSTNFGIPYDYDSVMHYSEYAFSKNRKKTIVPLSDSPVTLGQRGGLSDRDVSKLNRMYRCGGNDNELEEQKEEEEDSDEYDDLSSFFSPKRSPKKSYEVREEQDDVPQPKKSGFLESFFDQFNFGSWFR